MKYINSTEKNLAFFEALASPTRLKIIELLYNTPNLNIDMLAKAIGISNGAMTAHIKKLTDCGIVNVKLSSVGHGTQKLCSLSETKFSINLIDMESSSNCEIIEFNVGQYQNCNVSPTCGMADYEGPLFEYDLPNFFRYPEHFRAELLWYCNGYITFSFPNPLDPTLIPKEIQISMELSSEGPFGATHCPSKIDFYAFDSYLGSFDSPGEFTDKHGHFTPDWWLYGQYGELVTISITNTGTSICGFESSGFTLKELLAFGSSEELLNLKISCENPDTTGGITLFGKSFGNYPQGILMKVFYDTRVKRSESILASS